MPSPQSQDQRVRAQQMPHPRPVFRQKRGLWWLVAFIGAAGIGILLISFVEFQPKWLMKQVQVSFENLDPEIEIAPDEVSINLVIWRGEARVKVRNLFLTYAPILNDPVAIREIELTLPLATALRGKVQPSEIGIRGVRLPVELQPDLANVLPEFNGEVSPPNDPILEKLADIIFDPDLVNQFTQVKFLGDLQHFRVEEVQLDLSLADEAENLLSLLIDTAHIRAPIRRDGAVRSGQVELIGNIRPPDAEPTKFTIDGTYDSNKRMILNFNSAAVIPAAYARTLRFLGLEVPHRLTTPYQFSLSLALDEMAQVHEAAANVFEVRGDQLSQITTLSASANLQTQDLTLLASFTELDLRRLAAWTPVPDMMAQLALTTRGQASLRWHPPTGDWEAKFELEGGAGTMAIPQIGLPSAPGVAVGVRDIRASGVFDERGLALTQIKLVTGSRDQTGPTLMADLFLRTTANQPTMTLDIRASQLNQGDLFFLWPTSVAESARRDVARYVTAGAFKNLSFTGAYALRIREGVRDFVPLGQRLEAGFSDAHVKITPGLPPLLNAQGRLEFESEKLVVVFDTASFDSLRLNSGQLNIDLRNSEHVVVDIDTKLDGDLSSALFTLANGDIGLARLTELPLDRLTGSISGDFVMQLAFDSSPSSKGGISQRDLMLDANLSLEAVNIERFLVGQDIHDGRLNLIVTETGLRGTGTAKIAETPFEISINQTYFADQDSRLRLDIWADLSAPQLGLFVPNAENFLTGSAATQVLYERVGADNARANIQMNLSDSAVTFPALSYTKPVGETGSIAFEVELENSRPLRIRNLKLRGPDLKAEAVIEIGLDAAPGEWKAIELSDFRVGGVAFENFQIEKQEDHVWATGRGGQVDMGALLDQFTDAQVVRAQGDQAQGLLGFQIKDTFLIEDARIDFLDFGGATSLRDARLSLVLAEEGVLGYTLNAAVPPNEVAVDGGRMDTRLVQRDGNYNISIHADNFGALLEALHFSGDVRGGKLALTGTSSEPLGGGVWDLQGRVSNFRLAEVPSLLNLVSIVSLTGVAEQMSGQGLLFDELEFEGTMDAPSLQIRDLRLAGPSIGLLVSGRLNWATQYLELRGALAPFNVVNQIFEEIPILSELFTGSDGQGIFASQFEIFGPFENLDFLVDPFSILQPGIFRSIIDDIETQGF